MALAIAAASLALLAAAMVRLSDLDTQLASLRSHTASEIKQLQSRAQAVETAQGATIDGLAARLGALAAKVSSAPDPATIARTAEASVFTVITTTGDQGTAWVASSSGGASTLVTNFHVVETEWDGGGRTVQLVQGQSTYSGTVVAVAGTADLAAIRVGMAFPVLATSQGLPSPGDPVVVIGSPLGLGGSVVNGIVSAVQTIGDQTYIQFSAPISPGSSGSPVIDGSGKVTGIAEAKVVAAGAEGLGFAIPVGTTCSTVLSC
ncbi:MAG TPA: S1C family serine protease [Acidimicrobiales bacterium]|nr:S1C family serine protease [Acidimicrobiales bacterium]